MKVIRAYNVDEGLHQVFRKMFSTGHSVQVNSRNGPVARFNEPATIAWENPMQRVSFDAVRDANPVFHLFEAFWMLNGDEDVQRPAYFASHLATFSDDGKTLAGAYGYRWRKHWDRDQLDSYIIPSLIKNKEDRRCVLQMWDPVRDINNGLAGGKDTCCNISALFDASLGKLDMMVTNRSNDIVLGAAGANVVHFGFLQEYVAGSIGMRVGRYSQVSNNSHLYLENEQTKKCIAQFRKLEQEGREHAVSYQGKIVPLFEDGIDPLVMKAMIDRDVKSLMANYDQTEFKFQFESLFFKQVVAPVIRAFNLYKQDKLEQALFELTHHPVQSDWLVATSNWIMRRVETRNRKIVELAQEYNADDIGRDVWSRLLLKTWPSAVLEETVPDHTGVEYRAQVWDGKASTEQSVGFWNEGRCNIKRRGEVK